MQKTKFTVRVQSESLEAAKQYAASHGTTVTSLVQSFFDSLGKADMLSSDTPILQELAGSLSENVSIDQYHRYLEEKYLGKPQA
jgi:hypothetical protein